MPNKKGFTLIEILVVLIIVGFLAIIAIPSYNGMINQGASSAAQNNLISIFNAQKNYYLNPTGNGSYCTGACNSTTNINNVLSLNITDNNFTYACAADPTGFKCTATGAAAGITLTLKNLATGIVLLGGTGCTTTTGGTCNPSCAPTSSPNCPSG
jgi:prepilin-type N-terminal cleavage/methylation domain-containing protein